MKTLLIALFYLFSAASLAEEQFDSDKWNSLPKKAEEQAKKEFDKEFVLNRPGWECRKDVCFFVGGGTPVGYQQSLRMCGWYMKFNPEGCLIKVALWKDFPELVKFDNRRKELEKQFQEEYAKSIGMTVEECEKDNNRCSPSNRLLGRRGLLAQRKEREEKRKAEQEVERSKMREELRQMSEQEEANKQQERVELLPKIEQFVGYKFGQLPVQGIETNIDRYGKSGIDTNSSQLVKLQTPYRYMRNARLTYRNNRLCRIALYVDFGSEYSDASIEQELKEIKKDLLEKLGLEVESLDTNSIHYGGFSIRIRKWGKELSVVFSDEQTIKALDETEQEAIHKQGRALPSFEDWQKEESLKEEEKARKESIQLTQQKEQREKLLQRKAREEKRKAEQEAEKKRQEAERAKMREELSALCEEVRQAREMRERTALKAMAEIEKKEKERENELGIKLREKVEQFTGYKFGSPVIEGNGKKIRSNTIWFDIGVQMFETKLTKSYRYMKDVRLTYWNNMLCDIEMFVKFDKEYSDESISEEFEEMKKDIVAKLQLKNQYGKIIGYSANSWREKDLDVDLINSGKELRLRFANYQMKNDIKEAAQEVARKRGRKMPKFEESK